MKISLKSIAKTVDETVLYPYRKNKTSLLKGKKLGGGAGGT